MLLWQNRNLQKIEIPKIFEPKVISDDLLWNCRLSWFFIVYIGFLETILVNSWRVQLQVAFKYRKT